MTYKSIFFLYVHFSISLYYFHWTSSFFLDAFISFFTFLCLCNFSFSFLPFGVSFLVSLYLFPPYFLCSIVFYMCLFFLFIFVFFTFHPFALFLCFSSILPLRFVYFWSSIFLLPVAVLLPTPSVAPLSLHFRCMSANATISVL